jgi:hypothetical protein
MTRVVLPVPVGPGAAVLPMVFLDVGVGGRPAIRTKPSRALTDGREREQGSTTVRGRSALSWSFGAGIGIDLRPENAFQAHGMVHGADMGYDRAAALAGTVRDSIYL